MALRYQRSRTESRAVDPEKSTQSSGSQVIVLPSRIPALAPTYENNPLRATGEIEGFRERTEQSAEFEALSRADSADDYNIRIVGSAMHWVSEKFGTQALEKVARRSQVPLDELTSGKSKLWLSHGQLEIICRFVRELCDDDDAYMDACTYKMREGYGLLGLLLRSMSVQRVFESAERTAKHICKATRYEVLESERSHMRIRCISDRPESRLVCLSRQATLREFPRMWGLPAAHIEDGKCIGNGDDCCEYRIRWHEQVRSTRVFIGVAAGAVVGFGALGLGLVAVSPIAAFAGMGGIVGYFTELKRANRQNQDFSEETNRELREMAQEYAEVNDEIRAMHQEQKSWNRVLEREVSERTSRLQEIVDMAEKLRERSESELRNVTHDLRNPLTVLHVARGELATLIPSKDEDGQALISDVDTALKAMRRLTDDLLESASTDKHLVRLRPVKVEIRPLAEKLRRRLKAMIHEKDIRASVFCSREAPDFVFADELVFDRVVDNLLTNAVKYTARGSIVVELTGKPGMLTVKVLDTGPGISDEGIERVFQVGETANERKTTGSYGFGLSIVVRLLAQIGGQLEVMSKPSVGTTFWAHFPVTSPNAVDGRGEESLNSMIDRVVTIRRTAH